MPERTIPIQETEHALPERQPCKCRHTIRVLARPGFHRYTALIMDVSVCGIGLLIPERLEAGTVLALQLQGRHMGLSRILSARVLSASQHPDGNWYMNCALSSRFSEEELQGLLWEGP